MVCRRNLFHGKKQIKGKEGGADETSSTSQGFPRRQREGGGDREKEKPAGIGSGENPDGKALSSRSRVHSLPSLDFPSILLLLLVPTPVGTLWSRRKYLNDIFFLPLPVLLRSKNYTSRLCSWCTGTIINCLSFLSRDINHRENKIFLLTRCRTRDGASIPTISRYDVLPNNKLQL